MTKKATAKKGVVNIRGKEYKTVALRVNEIHADYKAHEYGIVTKILECNEIRVMVKASIVDTASMNVVATGHAEEFRSAGPINRTSALENAETSAIGRALAAFGYGGEEFASANEVQGAMAQQSQKIAPEKSAAIKSYLEQGYITEAHLEQRFGHAIVDNLLDVEADRIINAVTSPQENESA